VRPEMLKTSQGISSLLGWAVQQRMNIADSKMIALSAAIILTAVSLGSTQKPWAAKQLQ